MGMHYNSETNMLEYNKEQADADSKENLSPTEKTSRVIVEILNSIEPDLDFTVEITKNIHNDRLPTLDMEMWLENMENKAARVVKYNFFWKPMSTPFVVMENNALS